MTEDIFFALLTLFIIACFAQKPANVHAAEYTRNAVLRSTGSEAYPGVYYVKPNPSDSGVTNATIGIPSLDKNSLSAPTTESPAKIMGAAVYAIDNGAVALKDKEGNDLEIEIMNEAKSPRQFWSLRKAMTWADYDNSPIKMICEVPVLEGLLVEGHNVIFDVNSFDIRIANHQTTGAAGLTVRNGTLKVMDSFNTTGAELAVGNNARLCLCR